MNFHTEPYKEREIGDINPEDINVCVIGRIIDVKDGLIILDDGTGVIKVTISNSKDLKVGDIIRVFGQVFASQGEMEIRADFYQMMNGLDMNLYKKVKEVMKNV